MDKRTMDITLPQAPEGCGVMCLSASDDPVILSCNATAAEMIGISSDAGARKLFELVRIDDQYELNAQLRAARSGRRAAFECCIAHRDGGHAWICGTIAPGTPLVCTFFDATELHRRDADERNETSKHYRCLEQQNELMSRCLYNMPCGVLRYLPDGSVTFVNRYMLELIHADCDGAYAQHFWRDAFSIVPEEQRSQLRNAAYAALEQREPQMLEHDYIGADGVRGRVRETILRMDDALGNPALMSMCIAAEHSSCDAAEIITQLSAAMLAAYESVYIFNFGADEPYCMALADRSAPDEVNQRHPLAGAGCAWFERHIPSDARARMLWLLEPDTLAQMCNAGGGHLSRHFAREHDGEVSWHKLIVLSYGAGSFIYFDMDVTAQQRALTLASENAQLRAQAQLGRIGAATEKRSGCAVFEWYCDTGEVYRSPECARYALSRFTPEQLFNSHCPGVLSSHDEPAFEALCAQMRNGVAHAQTVVRLITLDGECQWTRLALECRHDAAGALLSVICTLTDIDADMRANVELESEHDRLEQIVANLPVGICIMDITDRPRLEYISPRALSIMGYAQDETERLCKTWLADVYSARNRQQFTQVLAGFDSGRTHEHVVEFSGQDGVMRRLRITCSPVLLDNGWRCYALITDVTDGELERARQDSRQELYALLSENSSAVLCDYDVAADRMTYMFNASGAKPGQRVYENYLHNVDSFVMIGDDTARDYINAFQDVINSPCVRTLEFCADFNDDGFRWYHCELIGMADSSGNVYRVIGRLDDVSQTHAQAATLSAVAMRETAYRHALTAGAFAVAEYDLATGRPIPGDPATEVAAFRDLSLSDAFELMCALSVHPDERDVIIGKYIELRKYAPDQDAGSTPVTLECRVRSMSGRFEGYRWIRLAYVCAHNAGGATVLIYAYDIDAEKHAEQRRDEMLNHDAVTGLLRRDEFERRCRRMNESGESGTGKGALAIIALNGMSEVNRRHGRAFGDNVLRGVADALRAIAGQDELIGRMSGAEFGMYTSHAESGQLRERMKALCRALRREPGGDTQLSACVGVAIARTAGEEFAVLHGRAHAALDHARNQNGEGFAVFDADEPPAANAVTLQSAVESGEMRAAHSVFMRTFGYFDVFVDGRALLFTVPKTKELLALLVDRHGGYVEPSAAIACLWEDEPANKTTLARYRKLAMRLNATLAEYGIEEIIESRNGRRRIRPELIQCDLYNFLSGSEDYLDQFAGLYMQNYSWGESTLARLTALRRTRLAGRGIVDEDDFDAD